MRLLSLITPSKSEFDDTVHGILKRVEYAHLKNPLKDFINKAKDGLQEILLKWFKKNLSNLENAASISDKLSTAFMIIGILAIAAIIVIIIIKINKTFERKRRVKEILGEKIDDRTTPSSLKQKALSFKEAGDLRLAIRYDFIALLLLMHEKNIVYLDETKTNEEIYKYLRKNSFAGTDIFKRISDMFNSTWYGYKSAGDDGYKEWGSSLEVLWNEVTRYEG